MPIVTELIDALPLDHSTFEVRRDEELLLTAPSPPAARLPPLWRDDRPPLQVARLPTSYEPAPFSPPRDVFAGGVLRLEWQQMRGRQPFYHRNADADEISYQLSGERTLMTELGTAELRPGDFARIPVGVAHDNFGREEVHLLFYVHAPALEYGPVDRRAEAKEVAFEGWTPATVVEMMTECLGARGCDIAVSLADERMLLDGCDAHAGRILIQRATEKEAGRTEWLYKSKEVWIGSVVLRRSAGETYFRHRRADAIQCQVSGTRLLVTQRGTVELGPGDFVCIPKGCAYTSIAEAESSHIVVLTTQETPMKLEDSRTAKPTSMAEVQGARERTKDS